MTADTPTSAINMLDRDHDPVRWRRLRRGVRPTRSRYYRR